MIPKIVDAEHIKEFTLRIKFDDGLEGNVDLKDELWGPIFEPLRSNNAFVDFFIHPELDTITWKNGADFSPEFLYEAAKKVPV